MSWVAIPSATMARIKAEAIDEAAEWLARNGSKAAGAKLAAYAEPYHRDAERGRHALTVGGTFRVPTR